MTAPSCGKRRWRTAQGRGALLLCLARRANTFRPTGCPQQRQLAQRQPAHRKEEARLSAKSNEIRRRKCWPWFCTTDPESLIIKPGSLSMEQIHERRPEVLRTILVGRRSTLQREIGHL